MSDRFEAFLAFLQRALIEPLGRLPAATGRAVRMIGAGAWRGRGRLVIAAVLAVLARALYIHPPLATVHRSEMLVRSNDHSTATQRLQAGTVLLLPGVHQVRRYPIRDQVYRPAEGARATGPAPFQSTEGLSIGVDLTVRWAIDRRRIAQMSKEYPDDLNADLVRPAVQGDRVSAARPLHGAGHLLGAARADPAGDRQTELKPKLAAMGLICAAWAWARWTCRQDYRASMEKLLAEELETEKVRYTLQLKEAQVKQTQLAAEADKVRRQRRPRRQAQEQVIAARAQEETMKHILPFKQKQIEQRQLEAEAEKSSRIRTAEGAAEARRIEAEGRGGFAAEARRRRGLSGRPGGQGQRGSDGARGNLIARYPLLIQKTLADKLSDKVQVIIAPTPAAGHFIGSSIIGDDP